MIKINFLKKIDILMGAQGLNKHTFSQKCGIPYTTVDGWYKKGYKGAKLTTIKKIAAFFETTLDYLMCDEITDINYGKFIDTSSITKEEQEILLNFAKLNSGGQQALLEQSRMMAGNHTYRKDDEL